VTIRAEKSIFSAMNENEKVNRSRWAAAPMSVEGLGLGWG